MFTVDRDDPARPDVHRLLDEHLADMFASSPAESVHALDLEALSAPEIRFWTAREGGTLVGCGALKELTSDHAELKSMRTTREARGRGVAAGLLSHILDDALHRRIGRVSLETGTQDSFAPARRLYLRAGFVECPPFAGYTLDPSSVFLTIRLARE
ncbi:GNAT family N-acetyltransferase [Cryobacterium sp. 10I1]|uniref:GNAT family N-acetyltransferase n=1 Tax=unclassified Cryobacterium TaxID=2649013 RepID=UPI002AC9B1DC|nr:MULTISPECIES: GNAT family N-acetyltransferase [unclassified Cryobacterium]MEB0201216.1 GNAT family N-acetyltransferase [Cryobacterium sp. 5I3]MEB0285703.1 GNAT family N-acetyltransferase [Cryobacterium sp. 10S3]MEB0305611.1 GNAT family N-acetyltransferase [Cryobacterium sp. 10I1]WPX12313.1 GNAT family N-acetyltransferase [Cryobacterium sp. 10S3]